MLNYICIPFVTPVPQTGPEQPWYKSGTKAAAGDLSVGSS